MSALAFLRSPLAWLDRRIDARIEAAVSAWRRKWDADVAALGAQSDTISAHISPGEFVLVPAALAEAISGHRIIREVGRHPRLAPDARQPVGALRPPRSPAR